MKRLMTGRRDDRPPSGDATHGSRRLRLPTSSAALAVSIVALVVAMAGSAYAGVTLGKGSVGSKQLKKGSVTNGKIAKGAITAGKLKAGLTVPNAVHANTADSATKATSATSAVTATSATTATNATNATNGFISIGDWTGGIATIPVNSGFVFAGPTTTLTTTATQTIVATSEAAMATPAATNTTSAEISICKAPAATGTPVTLLNLKVGGAFSIVTVGFPRISYPANATGAPGAGSWKIGECVNNTGATFAISNNDFAMGDAYVVNGAVVTGAVPTGPGIPSH
jgi:hypothetical protein